MPPQPTPDQALRDENAELRVRLEEAEEMLRAIRAGEVDALVVESIAGPQIFTLQGLDAEQNRLRGAMLAQVSDAVVTTDREDHITFLNPAAEQQYRVRSAEVLGLKVTDLYTRQWSSPEAEAAALLALEEHGHWCGEKLHRTRDGRLLLVEASIAILHDPETGERVGLIVAIRDITERGQAEERLRLAIAGSDLGTWHWDISNGGLDWSDRCLEIFGLPPRTAMSYEKFLATIHPEDRARADDAVQRALQDCSEYRIEFRSVWPDGSLHWAFSLGRAYYDAAGEPTRMEGIAIDITERKRAEEARHEMERNYRALAAATSEVAYRMSADWSTMLPLAGHELFVSSDLPVADWGWMDQYLPSDEHARVRQAVSEAIAATDLFEMEHRVLRLDGSIGWVRSRSVPILDENENVIAWFGTASDITARKEAEVALRIVNERFALAVKCSNVVLWQQDLELRFTWLHNPAPGIDGSDVVGKRDEDLLERAEDAAVIVALKREVIRSGVSLRQEFFPQIQGVGHCFEVLMEPFRDATGLITGLTGAAIDITDRKRAEEALRASEQFNQAVLDSIPAHVAVLDANGMVLAVNAPWRNFAEKNGLRPECCGPETNYLDVCRAAATHGHVDASAVAEGVEAVLHGLADGFSVEYSCHSPDEQRWFVMQAQRAREPLMGAIVSHWSITERKRAEEARHEMERNYRALAAASSEVAYRMSADWSTLLPLDGRQLVPSSDHPLADWAWLDKNIPPDEHPRIRQAIRKAISRKTLFELEHRVHRPDGSIGWTLSRAVPILDENKEVIAWFGAASDITERKAAQETAARLAFIVENTYDALFSEDLDGIVTSWNRGAEQIFGYHADEIIGTSIMRLIPDAGRAAEHELQRKIVAGKRGGTFEATRQAKDGREFHASITVSPMKDAAGRIIGTSRVIRDITDRKLAADSLRQAKEAAEAANRSKDRFLAALSHELRTPLTPVLLVSEVHAKSEKLPEDLREDFEMIHRNIVLEAQLIDDLLDVSRIQQGKMRFDFKLMDAHEALALTLEMLRSEVEEKALAIRHELNAAPATIEADPTRLRQVLCNLLRNAVKFTPRHGTITVHTARDQSALQISISDTGAGIAAEDLERIFQPFEQVDIEQQGEHRSIGLGLSISAAIVAAHRGRIWAESPGPGHGSTLHLRLPF